jgi:hypothetical protein
MSQNQSRTVMKKKFRWFLVISVLVIGIPILIWNFIKPSRVLVPSLAGFTRVSNSVYVDDRTRSEEAKHLYSEAIEFVSTNVWGFKRSPRVVFCTNKESLVQFGLSKQAAHTFGTFGIVIAPRGWKAHYVRHEMIHHLQIEQLGFIRFRRLPKWFLEGMAYSLSGDPRPALSEPWESYRSDFEDWYSREEHDRLWERAAEL